MEVQKSLLERSLVMAIGLLIYGFLAFLLASPILAILYIIDTVVRFH